MTSKSDRAKIKIIRKTVDKWRKILHLDPIWVISIELVDAEIMEGALARVDTSNTEYYVAIMEIASAMLHLEEDEFLPVINEITCHELVHLVMIDFVRSAQLAAGENESMHSELRYKYEQFTSRLQRAFMDLDERISELEEEEDEDKSEKQETPADSSEEETE